MISKSDFIILFLSSAALAVGVFRWHTNTQDISSITIPASSRNVTIAAEPALSSENSNTTSIASSINSNSQLSSDSGQSTTSTVERFNTVGIDVTANTTDGGSESSSVSSGVRLQSHIVESGDYLQKIANLYGTDVATLRQINGISGSLIRVGQEILYPAQ